MIVVIHGNLGNGVEITGPFETIEDAQQWAEKVVHQESWEIIEMWKPTSGGSEPYYQWPNSPKLVI